MNQNSTSNARSPARLLLRLLVVVLVLAGILFGSAGRLDWVEAWLLILVFSGFLIAVLVWTRRHAPDLLEERSQAARNVKRWDLVILRVYGGLLVALLVVAGLAVALGSWMALVPGLLIVALFAVRTILEDRMLHDELPGYREYAARVRHRWLPGVW